MKKNSAFERPRGYLF